VLGEPLEDRRRGGRRLVVPEISGSPRVPESTKLTRGKFAHEVHGPV
jgi:hypothetical protein